MKALARFETFLESMVEGSFRRLFRGRLEPVDLARRLAREMDDQKRVTWERPLVPNRYRILLDPADYADLESFLESLRRELAKFAADRAGERGYQLPGTPSVEIVADSEQAPGTFRVESTLVGVGGDATAAPAPAPAQPAFTKEGEPADAEDFGQTRAMRPLEMPSGPTGFEAIFLTGQVSAKRVNWPVAGTRTSVGRGLDNDVVLEDASVSRHHAEIVREGARLSVRDLGSTNGTWVNAGRVSAAPLHVGDQVAFGAVQLELARRPE